MKLSSKKNYLYLTGVVILATACSSTPNNVSINVSQGQCVQLSQYQSSAQAGVLAAFPMIESNPTTTAPYCMAITVQNNNTGNNANNIQITSSGVQVTTTIPGNTFSTTATLSDQYAAGFQIGGQQQTINNLALFDPYNCATTTGANVKTLNTGGGLCTFYLQILYESNPVGVYPYNVTFNYTNGNQNYNVNTTINQRTYLYGGDYYTPGLFYMSANTMNVAANPTTTTASWQLGLSGAPTATVQYILEGAYGYVNFAAGNSVYRWNGITTTQIGTALPIAPYVVTSLAYDSSGNIYASTNGSGMWIYNPSAVSPNWVQMSDSNNLINTNSNLIGLKGYESSTSLNRIYAISESTAYACTPNGTSVEACSIQVTNSPNPFFINAIDVDNYSNLYAGGVVSGNLNISVLSSTLLSWVQYSMSPAFGYSGSPLPSIGGVRWTNLNGATNLFVGMVNESTAESTVYSCISGSCTPLISKSGLGNPLSGDAYTLTTDGTGNLYVGGYQLQSGDYFANVSTGTTGAYQLFGAFAATGVGSESWVPILQIESTSTPIQINTTAVASMLTAY